MKIDDLHDLPWPRSTSVWFGEGDLDISCIVFCHITITQIWFDKKKYLGKKVYIQYLIMISRYLYNLQIYNVLILVSLSFEEDLVCSQAWWGWIFLVRPRLYSVRSSYTDCHVCEVWCGPITSVAVSRCGPMSNDWWRKSACLAAVGRAQWESCGIFSVSYTHLTLPTNREV